MDKVIKTGLVLAILLLVTACGVNESSSSGVNVEPAADSEGTGAAEDGSLEDTREKLREDFSETALPPATQLLLGTIMLEETEIKVDADLSSMLIPYWKLYRNLLESDTTAPEELETLINEIQEVMDPDQVNYIVGLELIQEDLMAYLNESGLMQSIRSEGFERGEGDLPGRPEGMPEGMGPGSGQGRGQGGPGSVEGMDPDLIATMEARREEMGTSGGLGPNRMILPLINVLLEILEGKISQ